MGNKDNVFHLAGAGSVADNMQSNTQTLAFNSESRGLDNKGTAIRYQRDRLGVEGSVALGPFKLQSEWIENSFKVPSSYSGVDTTKADMDGYYVSANYMLTGEKYASAYKAGKYDRITPLKDFNPEGDGWGAWEVGARFTSADGKDLARLTSAATEMTTYYAADSTTLGLKWIPTAYTRILLNYVDTKWENLTDVKFNEKALTLRTQMDF
jgi:phosphate-selective porin OprO/OprP